MQIEWAYCSNESAGGHGVEVKLSTTSDPENRKGIRLGFIEGFSWLHEIDPHVSVYLDDRLKAFPQAITSEVRLAILLFLTDKKRQTRFTTIIHGFSFWVNG